MLRFLLALLVSFLSVVLGFPTANSSPSSFCARSSPNGCSTTFLYLSDKSRDNNSNNNNNNSSSNVLSDMKIPNPFREVGDMLQNFDDVIDDFLFKRMGHGKRKYKPSGKPNTEGKYNGMGMSDRLKIDITRQVKEEMMERRRLQREQQQQQQQQQQNNKY